MIDIHTHILPGLDDGAKTVEDSLRMIRQAIDVGVEVICATPHVLDGVTSSLQEKIDRTFQLLCSQVEKEKLKIRLVLGSEIYIRQDIHFLARFNFFSLNQSGRYILLEFPLRHLPPNLDQLVYSLRLGGIVPIIAHPERSIAEKSQLKEIEHLRRLGALTQINAGSFLGQFGETPKRAAECLLSRDLVHVMASDAHDADLRSIAILRQAFAGVCQLVGRTKAESLVMSNPSRILSGEDLATDRCGGAAEEKIVQLKVADHHHCN